MEDPQSTPVFKSIATFLVGSCIGTLSMVGVIYVNRLPTILDSVRTHLGVLLGVFLVSMIVLFFVYSGKVIQGWLRQKETWVLLFLAASSSLSVLVLSVLIVAIPLLVGNKPTTRLQLIAIIVYGPTLMGIVGFIQLAHKALLMSE